MAHRVNGDGRGGVIWLVRPQQIDRLVEALARLVGVVVQRLALCH